jgi:hypothetical protein
VNWLATFDCEMKAVLAIVPLRILSRISEQQLFEPPGWLCVAVFYERFTIKAIRSEALLLQDQRDVEKCGGILTFIHSR